MRPVNLLPARHRPRTATASGGRAYAVLGVLALVLGAVVFYVHTVNSVRSSQREAARLDTESAKLEARAQALAPYATFASTAKTRIASVRTLAANRFDWERLVREMSAVLPERVWLASIDAVAKPDAQSISGGAGSEGSAGAASASSAGGASGESDGPSMKITGCAFTQQDVADTLVRLRRLHQAEDVVLNESKRGETGGGASSGANTAPGGSPTTTQEGCGAHPRGRHDPNYAFSMVVTFKPSATTGADARHPIPASLGGGQ